MEPGLDPPVTARVKVASVEGLDVVDPLVGLVADTILFACKESVAAYPNLAYPNLAYKRTNLIIHLKLIEAINLKIRSVPTV